MRKDEEDDDMMSHDDILKMPIFQKAMDILQMVLALKEFIDIEDELSKLTMDSMLHDAIQIPPKLSGAMAAGHYDLKMETATIVRKYARQVMIHTHHFWDINPQTDEYLLLLRNEIDEFRQLFVVWVEGFDPWNHIIDRWGLFNPPGVSAHDHDLDDEMPYDLPGLFGK